MGTDDGHLQVTRDLGKTWESVTERIPGLPQRTCVARIVPSRHAAGTTYVAFDAHRLNDFKSYIYVTTDFGQTWQPLVRGIPSANGVVHALREHHRTPELLFAGTETGLFVSCDRGANWKSLRLNLPTVPIYDIAIHPCENDLILGTHGRSIWILDDITALEGMASGITAEDVYLFDIRPATSWRIYDDRRDHGNPGHKFFYAENPPYGALITYFLKSAPAVNTKVCITIKNADGKFIQEIDGSRNSGINRIAWNLRLSLPPELTAGAQFGGGRFTRGPVVEPGTYSVTLAVDEMVESRPVVVEEDPRITTPASERAVRFDTLMRLLDLRIRASSNSRVLTELRSVLTETRKQWDETAGTSLSQELRHSVEELSQKADMLWERFSRPRLWLGSSSPPLVRKPSTLTSRISRLSGAIESYTAAPTLSQMAELEDVAVLTEETEAEVAKLFEGDLAELNRKLAQAGIPHIRLSGR